MCGRYNVIDDPFLAGLLEVLDIDLVVPTRLNVAPTEQVPVIIERQGLRQLCSMRWWLLPPWTKEINTKYASFNARCETVATSKLFGKPFKKQRAIMPVSSFIEWQAGESGKQAQLISSIDRALALAAVYEVCSIDGAELLSCSIVTRPATEAFSAVHKRMPVMLQAQQFDEWLDSGQALSETYSAFTAAPDSLQLTPISSRVNNARNKHLTDQEAVGDTWYLH